MVNFNNNIESIKFIKPVTEGQPGNRVFSIEIFTNEINIKIIIEKEQLISISEYIIRNLYDKNLPISSFDFDSELVQVLEPRLDDTSISVSLAAADYLVRLGEGALTLKAFTRALESNILWARIRAGAYLSYCGREELRPMQPLIPILQSAMRNRRIFGPEHDDHIKTHLNRMAKC